MAPLLTWLTGLSLLGLLLLAVHAYVKTRNGRTFALHLVLLALFVLLLHALFDFPAFAPRARGTDDVAIVAVLYLCMLLGMLAQFGYNRFSQPKRQRLAFDFGLFVAPILASPIIFIPLLAALQNADLDLANLTAPRMMVFFVAFENGFFWKEYFDHRRQAKERGES